MGILNSQTNLQKLRKKSADSLGIFQRTMEDLDETNELIQEEMNSVHERIKSLREERAELLNLQTKNDKVSSKIREFFGEI